MMSDLPYSSGGARRRSIGTKMGSNRDEELALQTLSMNIKFYPYSLLEQSNLKSNFYTLSSKSSHQQSPPNQA
jgi:hypothetical protein